MRIPLKADVPGAWLRENWARTRRPQRRARWQDWWLELSSAAIIVVVVIICVAHAWTAPLLLEPLLAVPPALAAGCHDRGCYRRHRRQRRRQRPEPDQPGDHHAAAPRQRRLGRRGRPAGGLAAASGARWPAGARRGLPR